MSDRMLDARRAGGPPNVFGEVRRALPGVLAWLIALALFFPIFWMAITAFKTEQQAYEASLFFVPTLDSFREVFARSNYFAFAWNSVLISAGVTVICLALAVPAAYAMAFFPNRRTQKVLLWMLSTKMMPSVGVLVPIYLLWKNAGLLDTVSGLVIVYALINLPIAVWMAFTYFNEIPKDILESGRIDGASTWQEIVYLLMPMALPGLASTALLLVILSWNEAFWSINLSSSNAAPLTVFIASYSSPEGCSGRSCRPRRCWRWRRSWWSAGCRRSNWFAGSRSERSNERAHPRRWHPDLRLRRRADRQRGDRG